MKTKSITLVILLAFGIGQAAQVERKSVFSQAMKKNIPVVFIIPDAGAKAATPLPVLYLLHGAGDTSEKWLQEVPQLPALADQYGILIACPDGGATSWYFDIPEDPTYQYETFMFSELVEFTDQTYHTLPSRKGRAITGLSMGGHGAMFLALRHKDVFGVVGCLSGGVDIRPFPKNWDLAKRIGTIEAHPERWEALTVTNLVTNLKNSELAITIDCGVDDFFLGVNRALREKLLKAKIAHDYTERPGGHSWDYWRNAIKYQMIFFSDHFKSAK